MWNRPQRYPHLNTIDRQQSRRQTGTDREIMRFLTTLLVALAIERWSVTNSHEGRVLLLNTGRDSREAATTRSSGGKRVLGSKFLALVGVALMIVSVLAFLNSLGRGGGYLSAAMFVCGAVLIVVAIVKVVVRAWR